ncbi:MAG: hypothetical protein ABFS56_28425 [Pseudomonadota bacterium]
MAAPIYSGKASKMPSKLDFKMARGLVLIVVRLGNVCICHPKLAWHE